MPNLTPIEGHPVHAKLLSRRRATLAVAAAGATFSLAAPAAFAQTAGTNADTVVLQSRGSTSLKLNKSTAKALTKLGITVAPIKPAKVSKGAVVFRITGGSLDPAKVAPAQINHSGGLRLSHGKTKVNLRNFRIRVNAKGAATLSAAVGGKTRATIINLNLSKAKVTRPRVGGPANISTKVSRVGVNLNRTGAAALNAAFKTTAFKRGLRLGAAVVDARPSQLIIESGSTALTPNAATIGVLTGAGISPGSRRSGDAAGRRLHVPDRPVGHPQRPHVGHDRSHGRYLADEGDDHSLAHELRHQARRHPHARRLPERRSAEGRHRRPRPDEGPHPGVRQDGTRRQRRDREPQPDGVRGAGRRVPRPAGDRRGRTRDGGRHRSGALKGETSSTRRGRPLRPPRAVSGACDSARRRRSTGVPRAIGMVSAAAKAGAGR